MRLSCQNKNISKSITKNIINSRNGVISPSLITPFLCGKITNPGNTILIYLAMNEGGCKTCTDLYRLQMSTQEKS